MGSLCAHQQRKGDLQAGVGVDTAHQTKIRISLIDRYGLRKQILKTYSSVPEMGKGTECVRVQGPMLDHSPYQQLSHLHDFHAMHLGKAVEALLNQIIIV